MNCREDMSDDEAHAPKDGPRNGGRGRDSQSKALVLRYERGPYRKSGWLGHANVGAQHAAPLHLIISSIWRSKSLLVIE